MTRKLSFCFVNQLIWVLGKSQTIERFHQFILAYEKHTVCFKLRNSHCNLISGQTADEHTVNFRIVITFFESLQEHSVPIDQFAKQIYMSKCQQPDPSFERGAVPRLASGKVRN